MTGAESLEAKENALPDTLKTDALEVIPVEPNKSDHNKDKAGEVDHSAVDKYLLEEEEKAKMD